MHRKIMAALISFLFFKLHYLLIRLVRIHLDMQLRGRIRTNINPLNVIRGNIYKTLKYAKEFVQYSL